MCVPTLRRSSCICCIVRTSKPHQSSGRNGTGLKQETVTCTSVLAKQKKRESMILRIRDAVKKVMIVAIALE